MDSICNFPSHPPVETSEQPPEDDNCPICIEGLGTLPVVKTKCSHRFHLKCITDWFEKQPPNIQERLCCCCKQEALPLVRMAGGRFYEDSDFCESLPLQACRSGDLEKLQSLLKMDINIVRTQFRSAVCGLNISLLHVAALNGHLKCLKALINAGADINAALTRAGDTPLYIAAAKGQLECLEALINAGADVNATRNNSGTPLHIAALRGHPQCVEALIRERATVDAQKGDGATPLHLAACEGHTPCVEVLIRERATVDARSIDDSTPLFLAANKGHAECLQALINAGADVNAERDDGKTPLHVATKNGHTRCMELLTAAGAINQTAKPLKNTICSVM